MAYNKINKINKFSYLTSHYGAFYDDTYTYILKHHPRNFITDIINTLYVQYKSHDQNADIYYGYVKNCNSTIHKQITNNKSTIEFGCEITASNINYYDRVDNLSHDYYINMINTNIENQIKYLSTISKSYSHILFYKLVGCIIPNYKATPITQKDVEYIYHLKKAYSCSKLFEYFQNFMFNYYILDKNIKTVYDIKLDYILLIKNYILNFIKTFLGDDFDEFYLVCKIIQYKNKFVYLEFYTNNLTKNYRYEHYYKYKIVNINLDDFIANLQKNKNIGFINELIIDEKSEHLTLIEPLCANDPYYNSLMKILKTKPIEQNVYILKSDLNINNINFNKYFTHIKINKSLLNNKVLFIKNNVHEHIDEKYRNLTIINFYAENKDAKPGSMTVIVSDKEYNCYSVTLHIVTFYALKSYKLLQEEIISRINSIDESSYIDNILISNTTNNSIINQKIYIGDIPGYFGISIKKINTLDTLSRHVYIIETKEIYEKYVLKYIKDGKLNMAIILTNLLLNKNISCFDPLKYYQNIKNEMTVGINDLDKYLSELLNSCIIMSKNKNFYIVNKTGFNNSYVLWFFPKFDCNNLQQLLECSKDIANVSKNIGEYLNMLDNTKLINTDHVNTGNVNTDQSLSMKIYYLLFNHTNYDDIFKSPNFVYNFKHLTDDHKNEIKELLNMFLVYIYEKSLDSNNETFKSKLTISYFNKYLTYCNYPLTTQYSIFHLQIINSNDIQNVDKYYYKNKNYVVNSNTRQIFWDTIKSSDTRNIPNKLHLNINLSSAVKDTIAFKHFNYLSNGLDKFNIIK
jgi:hypothetical protein